PELLYNVSGSKIGENIDWVQGYLQLPVNIQWGIDLMICKPYIQVSPFVGYCLSNTLSVTGVSADTNLFDYISDNLDRFDYGVGIGAGLELWKLQVSAKYIWNFGNVTDWNEFENNLGNITTDNAGAVEVSIAIKF
ncbi:MAG: porin family protein, partial [Bacteroidales bacterium]